MSKLNARRHALARLLALAAAPWLPRAASARPDDAHGENLVLLVASDRLRDPRFRETVLMVMRHGRGGPLGVILNRPSDHSRGKVLPRWKTLPDKTQPIFYGGPVAQRSLFYIARFAIEPPEVLTLAPGFYMGRNMRQLADMLDAGVRPSALRIYAGYAGWAPGQLEKEVSHQDWHVLPFDKSAIFDDKPAALYGRMLARSLLTPA